MSKLSAEEDKIVRWSPQEVRGIPAAQLRSVVVDPQSLFEVSGFLAGKEACETRLSPEEVISKAKQRADEIAKEAYNKGFEQGERSGFELGNKKAEAVAEAFMNAVEEVRHCREELLRQAETEAVRLAMVLAEKIIYREISLQEDVIIDVAREALAVCAEDDRIRIEVNPEDYSFLEGCGDRFRKEVGAARKIEIVANPAVRRGGCIVDTALGKIDARIEEKIGRLFGKLREKTGESPPETEEGESV
ncbi:MAG: hypothetical protein GXP58_04885 [Deltaproteobacteria bacterium]|nr:hypothetical protein [Deltaproteobacteria bacterium]